MEYFTNLPNSSQILVNKLKIKEQIKRKSKMKTSKKIGATTSGVYLPQSASLQSLTSSANPGQLPRFEHFL